MLSICSPLRRSFCDEPALPIATGVLVGVVAWIAIGLAGLFLLRTAWSDCAAAEPTKAYNFSMLLSRLAVASVGSISSGFVAVKAANENRTAVWWLGGLLLLASMPLHLPISNLSVWTDYPAWYHTVYLLSLMPFVSVGGSLTQKG